MKTVIAGVIALLAGLGIGLWFGMAKANAAKTVLAEAESAAAKTRERVVEMEHAVSVREAELKKLRGELAQARSAPQPEQETPAPEPIQPAAQTPNFLSELAQALVADEEPRPGRRGSRFREEGPPEGETEGQRDERRRSFAEDYRQRMSDFLTEKIASSKDPAEKERIASIGEYMQSLMEQRQQLRDAQTDEDRQAIFDTMRQNSDVLRSMVEEQQDKVMRDSLASKGITNRSEQDTIIQAYKESQDNPFFSGPFTMFGGGRGGGFAMRGPSGPPGGRPGPP